MRIFLSCIAMLLLSGVVLAQNMQEAEYFIDTDPGPGNGTPLSFTPGTAVTINATIPSGILAPGTHYFCVRFRQDGDWGVAGTTPFAVNEPVYPFVNIELTLPLIRGEYFFDTDPGPGNGTPFFFFHGDNIATYFGLTLSGVTPGLHLLGTRIMDLGFRWSLAKFQPLNVVDNTSNLIPIASFIVGPNPQPNVALGFTNTSQNTDINTIYQWDVNANLVPDYSTANISHTFTAPGIYPVRLTVINAPSALAQQADIRYYFTGGSLVDAGGTLNNLTASGGTPIIGIGRQGDMQGSFDFGPERYEAIGGTLPISSLSLSYWFKGTSAEAAIRIFDSADVLKVRSVNGANHTVGANSVSAYPVASDLYDGTWHHVALTWIPGTTGGLKSYLDGQLVASANTSAMAAYTLKKIVIGGIDGVTYSNGRIDDILVYDHVLTPAEIAELYSETYASTSLQYVEVALPPNGLSLSGNLEFCSGDTLVLTAPAGTNYIWNTGESTQAIDVTTSGSYHCAYTDVTNTPRLSAEVEVVVHQSPQVALTVYNATNGGANGSAGVAVIPGDNFIFNYNWSNGSTIETASNLLPGPYSVTVDDGQCPVLVPFVIANSVSTGQVVEAEYFFDGVDPGPGNGLPMNIPYGDEIGAFGSVSTVGLSPGIHIVSIRTRYSTGEWSITRSRLFSIYDPYDVIEPVVPGGNIVEAEYFFDEADPGPGNGLPLVVLNPQVLTSINETIDVSSLVSGFHKVSVRTRNELGHWSTTRTNTFLIDFLFPANLPDIQFPVVAAEYFIGDIDPGVGQGTPISIPPGTTLDVTRTIDITSLSAGTYKINVRTKDITGHWSVTRSSLFEVVTPLCQVPVADFIVPSGNAGASLFFDNTSTNVDPLAGISWDVNADGGVDAITTDMNYTFPAAGTYDVLLSIDNGDICIASIVQQVEVGPLLSTALIVSGALEFCEGDVTTLTAPAGSVGHIWNTGETTSFIQVSSSGTYYCFYTDGNGNAAVSDAVDILVHPALIIQTLINSATNGDSNGSAGVLVSGGSSWIYDFLWSTGATTPLVSGLPAGNYSVNISDGVCPQNIPIVIANTIVPLVDEIIEAEYFWGADPGVGNGNAIPVQAGNQTINFADISTTGLPVGYNVLSVRVRDAQNKWGITRTLPVNLTDPNEVPVTEVARPLVNGEYFFDELDPGPGNGIPIVVSVPGLNVSESFVADLSGLSSGNHSVSLRIQDDQGRWGVTRTASFFIIPEFPPNLPDFPWPVVDAEYFFDNVDPGPGNGLPLAVPSGTSILQPASVDVSALATGSHSISVRVRDVGGHWSITRTNDFDIVQPLCPVPIVSFTAPLGTVGVPVPMTNTSTNVDPAATYAWDVNANGSVEYISEDASHTFGSPGTYNVGLTIDNGGGCVSSHIQPVVVGPVYSNLLQESGPLAFCEGGAVTLTAPAGSNYLWNTGASTQSILVATSGLYQCFYVDQNGINAASNIVVVTVAPLPDVVSTVYPPTNGDANGSIGLLVSGGSAFIYSYTWSNAETTPIIAELNAGNYSVQVSDGVCPVDINFVLVNQNVSPPDVVVAAEYFWDNADPGPGNGIAFPIPEGENTGTFANLPTLGLTAGYHILSVRTMDSEGEWGITRTIPVALFEELIPEAYVIPDILQAEFFFDDNDTGPGTSNPLVVSAPGTTINEAYSLDCSSLGPGEHIVSVRVRDEYDQWSITRSGPFNLCFPPNPPVITSNTTVVCEGDNLLLSATNPGNNLLWTAPNSNTFQGNSWLINAIDLSYDGTFTVASEGDPGCFSESTSVNIHVEVPPAAPSPILGPSTICVTDENGAFFIQPIPNADNFDWNLPPGTIILSGNNTNNILCDFSNVTVSPVQISVVVSNECGSVSSGIVIVELTCIDNAPCPGDFDNNGFINISDLLLFMAQFGCPSACGPFDMDGNGPVNIGDLLLFMSLYGTSCP